MKTIIGIAQSGRFSPQTINIASEFFGIATKENNKKEDGILWLTFPSKKSAQEFSHAIHLQCVDKNQEIFK